MIQQIALTAVVVVTAAAAVNVIPAAVAAAAVAAAAAPYCPVMMPCHCFPAHAAFGLAHVKIVVLDAVVFDAADAL